MAYQSQNVNNGIPDDRVARSRGIAGGVARKADKYHPKTTRNQHKKYFKVKRVSDLIFHSGVTSSCGKLPPLSHWYRLTITKTLPTVQSMKTTGTTIRRQNLPFPFPIPNTTVRHFSVKKVTKYFQINHEK